MNTETGKLIKNPSQEQIAKEKLVELTPPDLAFLQLIPEAKRAIAWNGWNYILKNAEFKDMFVRNAAKRFYYLGFAAGAEEKKVEVKEDSDEIKTN